MTYTVIPTSLPDVLILEPRVFGDERGFFFESFNKKDFSDATGVTAEFVQDNHSRSVKNVLRGLHYQVDRPQGKLIRVALGGVFDVAVDVRKNSATFGHWIGVELTAENKKQLWIPAGFAHGFVVTTEIAELLYKTTDYWHQPSERSILWNDPDIEIDWPAMPDPILAPKDATAVKLANADLFP